MKRVFFLTLTALSLTVEAAVPMAYPKFPEASLTPGSLCDTPDRYRHPEQVPYCERNVNSFLKETVFLAYKKYGYRLSSDRTNYKIDHFIPLCFGGSNYQNNLWPQHLSVSAITDPVEAIGCDKLGQGLISHQEALDLIVKAKLNLSEAPKIFKYLKSLK